jgi:hypothetical protein
MVVAVHFCHYLKRFPDLVIYEENPADHHFI